MGPSIWDPELSPRRAARSARKTASTRDPALTQVGRAPSLMLKEPTSSSPLEKLMLWGSTSRCPETFPGLEGAKLGVLTGRQSPLGQRQSKPGHCAMEEEKWPLGTDPGRLYPHALPSRQHLSALPVLQPVTSPFLTLWLSPLTPPAGTLCLLLAPFLS